MAIYIEEGGRKRKFKLTVRAFSFSSVSSMPLSPCSESRGEKRKKGNRENKLKTEEKSPIFNVHMRTYMPAIR